MNLTPEQMAQARTLIAQEKQREAAWLKCIENWKPKHENRSQHSDYLAELLAANQGARSGFDRMRQDCVVDASRKS